MARLKSRQMFVPNGFKYFQPETKWMLPPNLSFDSATQAIIAHRRANPHLITIHKWSVDPKVVADELDLFNARMCQQMGWDDYITGQAEPVPVNPQLPRPSLSSVKSVAAGAETLVEWIKDGAQAVGPDLANNRAKVCSECPKNGRGDFTRWFTIPVSQAIRREVAKRYDMKLSTPYDDKLNVCEACFCPLKLKVHVPIDLVRKRLSPDLVKELDPRCWILHEV